MTTVFIALGSNLAEPLTQLRQAVNSLNNLAIGKVSVSSFYRSQPLGPQDQPDYINAVATFDTSLSPLALLDQLQAIENRQGRIRTRRWGERTLDLDILIYGNETISQERLTIPHYDMKNREFVIVPLYELAPDLTLPDGSALADLYQGFKSHQMQRISL